MEQRPEPGMRPFEAPSADVARAYLDESARVAQRREDRIDRRAAARLLLVEGAAFAVYLAALMLAFPPVGGINIIVIIVPFLIWTQLVTTLREQYGYQRRGREQRLRVTVVIILLVMVVGSLVTLYLGLDIPVAARLATGAVAFLLYGVLAWDEWRRATSASVRRERTAFDRTVRVTTACVGIGLGMIIACVASPSALIASVVNLVVMLALAGWLLSATVTGGSRIATAWGPFQWTCFAVSGALVVILLMLAQFTSIPLAAAGYVAGGVVALAFAIGAVLEPERG